MTKHNYIKNPNLSTYKRPADERGVSDHGWLRARFTFSFADYYDESHMGFHSLRVMNNDTIAPGRGFPDHPHSEMEIFTYVIEGKLTHRDSMGNEAVLTPGRLQYMSAANGIRHSEFNPSTNENTTLYQIWLEPKQKGGEPVYFEKALDTEKTKDTLTLLYSGSGRSDSTKIRQDAEISFGETEKIEKDIHVDENQDLPHSWIQIISGEVETLGQSLKTGDGLAISNAPDGFSIRSKKNTKFLLFRLC
tara:strand:- start:687 stop:1430 length:744 start_codon:yes stop_codon:yes gene_type:complete